MTNENANASVQAVPDIAQAASEMDAHARRLDQEAAKKAAEATKIRNDASEVANRLIAEAKHAAARHIAEQGSLALPAEEAARKLRIQADYWRHLAAKERERAEITAPEQPPFARTLAGTDEEEPRTWTGPDGRTWDLHVAYADASGQRWHWAGGFESVEASDVMWPLMSHDDFGVTDVPLCRCPQLWPVPEVEQTGQFPAAQQPAEVSDAVVASPSATQPDGQVAE